MNPEEYFFSVAETIEKMSQGKTPFDLGPFDQKGMRVLAEYYLGMVDLRPFLDEIEHMFTRGEDPNEFIANYLSLVFLTGLTAGSKRTETL